MVNYYKCTLLSDIVLNNSLATEGNVGSLEYISGNVFLGIIANKVYEENIDKAFEILHSGKVKFGDGIISRDNKISYHYPASLLSDKADALAETKYLHHLITKENFPKRNEDERIQPRQIREHYFNVDGVELVVEKRFSMKSARDATKRKSADAQMFGYNSINARQTFIFPIYHESDDIITLIEENLIGIKRIGKSKTAQYSMIEIEKVDDIGNHTFRQDTNYNLVYANSHLCFLDENAQPNLQPNAADLGITGNINWEKSQIRTYDYTSWNAKRKTPNSQRFCIARGSVFFVESTEKITGEESFVGEYQAEGLGHVLINPTFLFVIEDEHIWGLKPKLTNESNDATKTSSDTTVTTKLAEKLKFIKELKDKEFELAKEVIKALKGSKNKFKKVTASQWGGIRNAALSSNDEKEMLQKFFDETKVSDENGNEIMKQIGLLNSGVAYERYWKKSNNLNNFKSLIEGKSCAFVAKFASEKAKEKRKNNDN